ncbi:hypothetical protein RRG08_003522 [Elysia crispata]|uniref:Uncharacterized protein n=1 Tax=Elysia crispata TaxID=231223 RepID=A0AAE0Y7I7_9GAST|nr:hypothetical protein RRG08_003522 [Elysia crispata]
MVDRLAIFLTQHEALELVADHLNRLLSGEESECRTACKKFIHRADRTYTTFNLRILKSFVLNYTGS